MVTNTAAGGKTRRWKPETRLSLVRRARRMNRILAETYPDAHCELNFDNAFQLLVATVLSAQTTDVRVNLTTPALFAKYPTPQDMAEANPEDLETILKPTGFFRAKTKSVMGLSAVLRDRFGGEVPSTMAEMITLPGVGRKTANVVLGNAFGVPGITVDTHFQRLTRRFRWTGETDPVRIEQEVGDLIPRPEWTQLSHRLIWHGRRVCHARRPACGACVIGSLCPSYGEGPTDPVAARKLVKPGPILMIDVPTDLAERGNVPEWLSRLAATAPHMPVAPIMRPPEGGGRPSAVLVLFGTGPAGPDLLLIQRSSGLREHPGQPAFPGGAIDPGDGGPVGAALREAAEETGLDPSGVVVITAFPDLYLARSGFRVTPVLAWWREPCPVAPVDIGEVAAVARVPISELVDPANRFSVRHRAGITGPAFRVRGMLVWGFTAGLVDRLLALGGWEGPWDRNRIEDLPPDVAGLAARD